MLSDKGVISSKAVHPGRKLPIYRQTGNKSKFFNPPHPTRSGAQEPASANLRHFIVSRHSVPLRGGRRVAGIHRYEYREMTVASTPLRLTKSVKIRANPWFCAFCVSSWLGVFVAKK